MSRQQSGGGGSEVARGAGYAAFLGALLIGVAVIIGIVLLQIGDRNDNGPVSASHNKTTTTKPSGTTTSTTKPTVNTQPAKTPSQVNVMVLNGGAASGSAANMAAALKRKGYTNDHYNTWTGHHQTGNSVYCRAGLDREGAALAVQVGPNTTLKLPLPTPAPPSNGADCVVVVGAKS